MLVYHSQRKYLSEKVNASKCTLNVTRTFSVCV